MSVALPTVAAMSVHPWRALRKLAHITLKWHDGDQMGRSRHSTQTISIRRGMTYEERRCTVQHEIIHLERGPVPLGWVDQEEERVRRETAFRMLPFIKPIGDALAWALSPEEAAEELAVDIHVLRYRLRHMSPAEQRWMRNRLQADDAVEGSWVL